MLVRWHCRARSALDEAVTVSWAFLTLHSLLTCIAPLASLTAWSGPIDMDLGLSQMSVYLHAGSFMTNLYRSLSSKAFLFVYTF